MENYGYKNEKYFDTSEIGKCRIENIEDIPLMNIIRIDNYNYGRIDLICMMYYHTLDVRSIILDYNKISDLIELKIGQILRLPDLQSLISNIKIQEDLTENCPGIIMTSDNRKYNESKNANGNSNETVACPKLDIAKRHVTYDEETGIITY